MNAGDNPGDTLKSNDHLVKVDGLDWDRFAELRLSFPSTSQTRSGSHSLEIQRGDNLLHVNWMVPGINLREFLYRILTIWWLPFAFWLSGVVVSLLVRPKEIRWLLLYLFFYLIALGVSAGAVSTYNVVGSLLLLRISIWLLLPVSWHLHWIFPKPIASSPRPVLWLLYAFGGLLILAEWFRLLPSYAYIIGFLLIVINTVILMIVHIFTQPEQRRSLVYFMLVVIAIVLPTVIAASGLWQGTAFLRWSIFSC